MPLQDEKQLGDRSSFEGTGYFPTNTSMLLNFKIKH